MTGLTAATDKVVFTHVGALRAKYGSTGVSRLRAALRTMISNDRGRGVVTTVVDVSSAAALRPVGEPRIADAGDHDRFRRVLDAVCALAEPDYVLLYGGPDIVPLVPLANPMPAPDPDPDLPSDLPYAVPGGLTGLDATALVGPTRVVGRLPDTVGAGGLDGAAAYARLTRSAARWRSVDRAALGDPLCLEHRALAAVHRGLGRGRARSGRRAAAGSAGDRAVGRPGSGHPPPPGQPARSDGRSALDG